MDWQKIFAWKPIRISRNEVAWLEFIERKPGYCWITSQMKSVKHSIYYEYWTVCNWKYRKIS